jgi:hypothetical protein
MHAVFELLEPVDSLGVIQESHAPPMKSESIELYDQLGLPPETVNLHPRDRLVYLRCR